MTPESKSSTWAARNPERRKEIKRRSDHKRKEKVAATSKTYAAAHRQELSAKAKVYWNANRDKKADKDKRYRERHRERLKEKSRSYYAANKEERKAKDSARYEAKYAADPEAVRAKNRLSYKAHRDGRLTANRQWNEAHVEDVKRSRKSHYERNKEQFRRKAKEWLKSHPDERRAYVRNRRAKAKGNGGTHTGEDIKALFATQHGKCAACGHSIARAYHVDHVMPISLGGSNGPENLQLLCPPCNLKKHNMHPDQWAALIGKLFV